MNHTIKFSLINLFVLLLISCASEPEPIKYGEDNCANCMMGITDPRYGSELITEKSKIYKFDSIECMAAYSKKFSPGVIASMWVSDFNNRVKFINTAKALYLQNEKLRSPMGLNLTAFSNRSDFEKVINNSGGKELSWDQLIEYVSQEWNE